MLYIIKIIFGDLLEKMDRNEIDFRYFSYTALDYLKTGYEKLHSYDKQELDNTFGPQRVANLVKSINDAKHLK